MTYREKIRETKPNVITPRADGGVLGCPFEYFEEAGVCPASFESISCEECWDREIQESKFVNDNVTKTVDDEKEPTSFQEDMMTVLGDMTKAQARFAIEWLWNKYFKEEN